MSLAVDENRLSELARKAVDKSGNLFFQAVVSRTNACARHLLESTTLKADDFQAAESTCTPDNLILLSRYYAGEIIRPRKQTHRHTLFNQVMDIMHSDDAAVQTLNIIFIAPYLHAAHDECEARALHAKEAQEFLAQNDADEYPAEVWTRRADAIFLTMESWEMAAEAAKAKDWKKLVTAFSNLVEVEA
jgi:hypothetical protein